MTGVRTRTHKLSYCHSLKTGELYDLERDPGEFRNLWSSPNARDVREGLLLALLNRMADTVDPLPARNSAW